MRCLGGGCVSVPISVISGVWDGSIERRVEANIHACQGCICREDWMKAGVFPGVGGETIGCQEEADVRGC